MNEEKMIKELKERISKLPIDGLADTHPEKILERVIKLENLVNVLSGKISRLEGKLR